MYTNHCAAGTQVTPNIRAEGIPFDGQLTADDYLAMTRIPWYVYLTRVAPRLEFKSGDRKISRMRIVAEATVPILILFGMQFAVAGIAEALRTLLFATGIMALIGLGFALLIRRNLRRHTQQEAEFFASTHGRFRGQLKLTEVSFQPPAEAATHAWNAFDAHFRRSELVALRFANSSPPPLVCILARRLFASYEDWKLALALIECKLPRVQWPIDPVNNNPVTGVA